MGITIGWPIMNRNRNRVLVVLLWGVVFSTAVQAQDFRRQYTSARAFFDKKQYGLAMEAFKPLIVYDKDNVYQEYASFFYALSAYHQKFTAVAKDMLLQIKQLHPDWDQMPEVNYWLAKIYFDQREYFQAMHMLGVYPALNHQKNVVGMKSHYLGEIEDVEVLRMMWEEYPRDTVVAKTLVRAISRQPLPEQDAQLIDSLVSGFGFDRNEFESALMPANVFKDEYVVSLLFPFLAGTLEPTTATKVNQSILDLYLGIKMAADSLRGLGINIDLRAYDTERSIPVTLGLLEKEEMKSSDLIVGPLFQNQVKPVQDFSIANKINMISPVSGNSEFFGDNPFGLLLQPRSETIGERSAEWIAAHVRNKNCMVFYGETAKDTVTAASFLKRAKELDLNIVWAEKVARENSVTIFNKLATPVEYDEFKNPIEFELKIDSIGSVFMVSDDPILYTKVISGVDTRGDSTIIVGNESWLNNAAANFATYERLHITMAAPTFTSASNPNYEVFRQEFIRRHGILPTEFSKIGFEFMWFVGHSLKEYGVYFQEGLKGRGFVPGYLFRGYDFSTGQSNQFVPFVHFKEGRVEFVESLPPAPK